MGLCLSKANYGKDTVGPDCGPLTSEAPLYCACCQNFYPCCLPKNNKKHARPRVLSLQGLSADEKKLWKCLASGNPDKARQLMEGNSKKGEPSIASVSAIRLEGGANLLVGIASVDYSAFSTESAKFLLDEHQLDVNHVSEKTSENALMAALRTFAQLRDVTPCGCCASCGTGASSSDSDTHGTFTCLCCCATFCCCSCTVFEENVRKQHCLELAEYLVEAGIDMDYHGAGETALQCLIDLFCKEAAQCLSVSVAASTGGFDAKGACLALAENGATKMTQMDYQNEETPHVLHKLLDAIGNERALSVSDVTSLLKLTELILCNKTEHLDINCRAKNGKGDNLLCAYIQALAAALAGQQDRLVAIFSPVLGFMKFTCTHGLDVNFVSPQDGCNALHLALKLVNNLLDAAQTDLVKLASALVQFSHCLVEHAIDVNHTSASDGCNALHLSLRIVKSIEQPANDEVPAAARELVDFAHCLVQHGIDVNRTPEDSPNAFIFALNMVDSSRDEEMPSKLVDLCLLLIDKDIKLGDGGQVDPEVLFKVFKMIESHKRETKTVESLFKLIFAIVQSCTIDLNHLGHIETLKTSVTPLLLVLRMHGSYARAADAPAGYLQVARTLLSMPEVDANKVAGDKVSALLYVLTRYVQSEREDWKELLQILLDRRNTDIDAVTDEIEAVDFSVAHLIYPEGMPVSTSSCIPMFMFDGGVKVSCLGMVIKALVNGPEEIKCLKADLEHTKQAVEDKSAEADAKHDVVKKLVPQVDVAKRQVSESSKALEEAEEEVKELSDQISDLTQQIKEARERQSEAEQSLEADFAPTEKNVVHPDPAALRREVAKTKKDIDDMEGEKNALSAELKTKESAKESAKVKYEADKQRYEGRRSELDRTEDELKLLIKALDQLNDLKSVSERNLESFSSRLYPDLANRLQGALDLLLQEADANQGIDSNGNNSLLYIIKSMESVLSWAEHSPQHGDALVTVVEKILAPTIARRLQGLQAGKALHCLAGVFGSARFDATRWWQRLLGAILGHPDLDIEIKDGGVTPLLAFLKNAGNLPREICSVNEDVFVKLVTMIAESKEKGGGGARVDVREEKSQQEPQQYGALHYLLLCHTEGPLSKLKNLQKLLKLMLERGIPPNVTMAGPAAANGDSVRLAHLAYFNSLCNKHGGGQGISAAARDHIKRIMELFIEVTDNDSVHDLGEEAPDNQGSCTRGYMFFLWDLFYRRKVNIEDLNDLFSFLKKKKLDLLSAPATTSRPHWSVFSIRNNLNVSMLMLVVDAIVKEDMVPTVDMAGTVDLAKLILKKEKSGEKEKRGKDEGKARNAVNDRFSVSTGEGRNNVLHYVFKFIIDTCMKKSLGDLRKGKEYDALKDLVKGKGSVKESGQDQDVVSLPQPAKRNVLQLRALLDMLALLQDYCDFGMHSFVHEEPKAKELIAQLKRDGIIPRDIVDRVHLHDSQLLSSSGLHPVEAVFYGALLPVLRTEDEPEIDHRFRVAEYLLRYLLDDEAKGPHENLVLKFRKDSPNLIVCAEDDNTLKRVVWKEELGLHSRFTPVDMLVFTLSCLAARDPDLAGKRAKDREKAGTLEIEDNSAVLKIARLLLQKCADPNPRMFRECAPRRKEVLTRRLKSEPLEMGECPLLLLAFDALSAAKAPPAAFEAVIGLLLEFDADPTLVDENKETLLMRIAKRALSRELIMPFLDENERDVPEENEDAADAAIDRCTDMLLALKENTFVKKKPNFCNLPNLDGKNAFLLGVEELVKNKRMYSTQVQIIHQLLDMNACPILKDTKGADAANVLLTKAKDRDAKDVMRRAADKFERDYDRALCNGDIPFLETLIKSGAVDVTNRFKSGDGLAIWAARNGRANILETLLDADRGGKMFADKTNYIQNEMSILHLAVKGLHRDAAVILLTHQSCKSVPLGDGRKGPLKDFKCDEMTALEAAGEMKDTGMTLLFNPTMASINNEVSSGKGLGLVADILTNFFNELEDRKASRGKPQSGEVTDSKESAISNEQQSGSTKDWSVASVLHTRHEDGMSILMKAAHNGSRPGAVDLVKAILNVCDSIESYVLMPSEAEPPDEVQKYMNSTISVRTPKYDGSDESAAPKPKNRCEKTATLEPKESLPWVPFPSELAKPQHVRDKLTEDGFQLLSDCAASARTDPWVVDVVDSGGTRIFSYQAFQTTTVREWKDGQKKRKSMHKHETEKRKSQPEQSHAFFHRPRYLVNPFLDDEDEGGKTALYYAVLHDEPQTTRGEIVDLLLRRGARFGKRPKSDEGILDRSSEYVKRLLLNKNLLPGTTPKRGLPQLRCTVEEPRNHNKWHLFMSHAQALSQQSIFEVVRNLEELTENKIKIWTDQRVNPTDETMKYGVRRSEMFVFYMGMGEDTRIKVPARKESNQRRSGDSEPKLESVEAWLKRVWPKSGLVKIGGRTIYDHPGTIWRFWCLYELAVAFDIIKYEKPQGDQKREIKETKTGFDQGDQNGEKEVIFIAEGNSRQGGGSGESYSGVSKGMMNPYKRQLQELREVMENENNRLKNQETLLTNKQILTVLEKLEDAMGPNNEVMHWPSDPYERPGVAKKLLEINIFPSVSLEEDKEPEEEEQKEPSKTVGNEPEKGQSPAVPASDSRSAEESGRDKASADNLETEDNGGSPAGPTSGPPEKAAPNGMNPGGSNDPDNRGSPAGPTSGPTGAESAAPDGLNRGDSNAQDNRGSPAGPTSGPTGAESAAPDDMNPGGSNDPDNRGSPAGPTSGPTGAESAAPDGLNRGDSNAQEHRG